MREAAFILLILFLLFGLTAFRYRKHIAGILAFGRSLREIREMLTPRLHPTKKKLRR
ncbi:MAG: hypothetical protein UZ17_ACD001000314 [Acidobacteria bacterium OLB17]|nr:MAG: hypothetical protein UZ17_ACD001000314 [Acidobacteria bacterium OLB17]